MILQTTHRDFSQEISDRFHPLSFYFLLVKSFFFSFTWANSNLLCDEYLMKSPVYYLFYHTQVLDDVFDVEDICVGSQQTETPCQLTGKKLLNFFRSFFSLGKLKKLWSGRFLELFLYTEMAQYIIFICFAFKTRSSVVSLFP